MNCVGQKPTGVGPSLVLIMERGEGESPRDACRRNVGKMELS